MRFRTRIFLAGLATAVLTAVVAASLMTWSVRRQMLERIERSLVTEVRLLAEIVERQPADDRALQEEAGRLGTILGVRVTLVDSSGRVVAESTSRPDQLDDLDNHNDRPEVVQARRTGLGTATRFSATVGADMLYVALPVAHGAVDIVRVSRPLSDIEAQLATIRRLSLLSVGAGVLAALGLAWAMSAWVGRRVGAIAAAARRYRTGDLTRTIGDRGADEIGVVARALDESVQELGSRLEELARDRARTGAILSGMVEGVLVVDEAGRLQQANAAACRMLALDDPPPVGRQYLELVRHPDIVAVVTAGLQGRRADAVDMVLPTQPDRIIVGRGAPVASPGGGVILVLHDVTDLRRADQIRRDFVANVSHELRTPLTAIRGYAEALLDDPPSDPADARRFLQIIDRHGERMQRLVDDLLRLARLDAGREQVEAVRCGIEEIVADLRSGLGPTLEARRQVLESRIESDAAVVMAEPVYLHDVLRNLVENAIRYAPEGTTIRISSRPDDGHVRIAVADEGPGIPDADLSRIFERFYRVDKARDRQGGGTGLGLAIAKHLAGLQGGTIQAANRPDGGAVFTVTLPRG
jgi:two-component system, OmpR family, phosphate regulon sensor histidine kinase PhoR